MLLCAVWLCACTPQTGGWSQAPSGERALTLCDTPARFHGLRPPSMAYERLSIWHVERVVDGDTLILRRGRHRERVRLIGVDAPESSANPDVRRQTHAGDRVTACLQVVLTGRDVRLEYDREPRDRFGRLLAYVWLTPTRMVNEDLVYSGLARVVEIAPNTRYAKLLRTLERDAQQAHRGLDLEPERHTRGAAQTGCERDYDHVRCQNAA